MGITKLVGEVVSDWGNMLSDLGGAVSGLVEPSKKHAKNTWIIFGDKGSGKHELLAALACTNDYVDGFPHAKDYADVWQRSFSREDDEGDVIDTEVILLGPDPLEPQRMIKIAKKYLKPGELDFPCFLVNLKQFMQDGESVLQKLFAQFLFFWRVLLRISQLGLYDGVFDAESLENAESDYFAEALSPATLEWTVIATHFDEIPEKNRNKAKKLFMEKHKEAMEYALNSTFGRLFEQISDHVNFNVVFADLFHKDGRFQFVEDFYAPN